MFAKVNVVKATLLASAAVVSFSCLNAQAAPDGTINFQGQVLTNTCVVAANNATAPSGAAPAANTVVLPVVSSSVFSGANSTAGVTPFKISLTACNALLNGKRALAFFEKNGTNNDNVVNTAATTPATGVALQLLNGPGGSPILLGNTAQLQQNNSAPIASVGGAYAADLNYAVQYIATAATVGAGAVTGSVTYTINYQ